MDKRLKNIQHNLKKVRVDVESGRFSNSDSEILMELNKILYDVIMTHSLLYSSLTKQPVLDSLDKTLTFCVHFYTGLYSVHHDKLFKSDEEIQEN